MDAAAWNARYAGDEDLVWASTPNQIVAEELAVRPIPPGTALDLGCGEGRHAVWLAAHGWRVRAVDFAEAGIAKGRRLATHAGVDVDWVVADVVDHDPGGRFDLVLLAYLHLEWPAMSAVLERAARSLHRGGTLLAVGHHVDNLEQGIGGPQDRRVLHDPAAVAAWAAEHDELDVVRAERVERPVGAGIAIDSVVRLRRH